MSFYSKVGNIEAILWCSVGSCLIGLILLFVGAIVTGIAYLEITPPDYDKLYDRYKGANLMRVTGPLALLFGCILIMGSCLFFVFAFLNERNAEKSGRSSRHDYNIDESLSGLKEQA